MIVNYYKALSAIKIGNSIFRYVISRISPTGITDVNTTILLNSIIFANNESYHAESCILMNYLKYSYVPIQKHFISYN